MAEEKLLGKIDYAEYGMIPDRPFLIGLQLGFSFPAAEVMDGGRYTVNISKDCRWEEAERQEVITKQLEFVWGILKDAKCNYVSELKGKPVLVTIEKGVFKDFRILKEVL